MGCLCSHGPVEESNTTRSFKVINVDDRGLERNPGRIEITECELVWYQRGREPIRWPLKSLRRYGFDAELFSFESGRRCPTGQGIYAFKCRRAEALFNLLQESIQRQRTGQDDSTGATITMASPQIVSNAIPHHTRTAGSTGSQVTDLFVNNSSRPNSTDLNTTVAIASADTLLSNGGSPVYVNGDIVRVNGDRHEYINTDLHPVGRVSRQNSVGDPVAVSVVVPPAMPSNHMIQYAELDLPKTEDTNDSSPTHSNGQTTDNVTLQPNNQLAMYINVPPNEIKKKAAILPAANGGKPANGTSTTGRLYTPREDATSLARSKTTSKVNYVQLDHSAAESGAAPGAANPSAHLNAANIMATVAAPESPTRAAKSDTYARIDIERTRALNQRRMSPDDDCSRKTRHNSNIEELYGSGGDGGAANNG